jgi:hypothetical protein
VTRNGSNLPKKKGKLLFSSRSVAYGSWYIAEDSFKKVKNIFDCSFIETRSSNCIHGVCMSDSVVPTTSPTITATPATVL